MDYNTQTLPDKPKKCNALNKKDIVYFVVMEFIYTFA